MYLITHKTVLLVILSAILFCSNTISFADSEKSDSQLIQEVIENYYAESYDMWYSLKMGDLTEYLDVNSIQSYNKMVVLEKTIERWKYGILRGYVSQATIDSRNIHEISYEYSQVQISEDYAEVKVTINPGVEKNTYIYPYFISFGENTFKLIKQNNRWLIQEHDYSDIVFYEKSKNKKISFDMSELMKKMDDENVQLNDETESLISSRSLLYTNYYYDESRAVDYADEFVSSGNSYFYSAAPADCTNFVSQAVSYGFGSTTGYSTSTSYRMVNGSYSTGWFAGSGGGSGPWEVVDSHWTYMVGSKTDLDGPRVVTTNWAGLDDGGVMQCDFDDDGDYDHSVICVDRSIEKFAQHSSNIYRYYDDYDATKRFYNPNYFRKYD